MLCLVAQLCPSLCNLMDCSPPGYSAHGDSPGKTTQVGCHALLQGNFPTQGPKPVSCSAGESIIVWATREAHKYWSGLPIPSPGGLPNPGFELDSPTLHMDSLPAELPRKPIKLPYDPAITLLGIRPEKTIIQKDTCTQIFLVPVSTISTTWKKYRCLPMNG